MLKLHRTCFILHFVCYLLIVQALASTLDEEELADLRDQFDAIDVDKNGSISLEEMRQVNLLTSFLTKLNPKTFDLSIVYALV